MGTPAAYDQQTATPYFYSARFRDSNSTTEFTVTERCGYFRFTFRSGKASLVLSNRIAGQMSLRDGNIVEGEEQFDHMKAYVYGVFSKPVTFAAKQDGARQRLVVAAQSGELEFRYGISFISREQAKDNLQHEIPDAGFEPVKEAAKARWNDTLGRIAGRRWNRGAAEGLLYRSLSQLRAHGQCDGVRKVL